MRREVIDHILDIVCGSLAQQPRALKDIQHEGDERFTTGDERLDEALGGGIRTGMIWEVVGERCDFLVLDSTHQDQ